MAIASDPHDDSTPASSQPALATPDTGRFARVTQPADARGRGEQVVVRDGRTLWLRAIAPTDVDAIQRCFKRLSADEVRMRFLYQLRELPASTARRLCAIDPAVEAANVLVDATPAQTELRGVGRIYHDVASNHAEFAVLVEKAWAGFGLGALLMQRLVDECRRRKIARLWGYVLIENRPMLDLCRQLGFKRQFVNGDPGTATITLDFA